ncbi:MAG: phosphatidate cytidylyltransferase [Kiritimatiellia bacterium]
MNPVLKRTLCGLAVGACVVAFFLYCPLRALPVVLLAVSTLVQLEFYQMARAYEPVAWFGLLMGAAWILLASAFPGVVGFFYCAFAGGLVLAPLAFLLACIVLFRSRYRRPVGTIASTLLGFLYVPFLLSFFLRIVQLLPTHRLFAMPTTRVGLYTLFFLIAVAKLSDTGGFAFGVAMGRHKMCPSISPNKSWEGLIGSMVFASATTAVFLAVARHGGWAQHYAPWRLLTYPLVVPVGIAFALVATAGDLIESRLKRECGVKDSSTFMPAGMGGFLDMFDSFIFLPALVYPVYLLVQM